MLRFLKQPLKVRILRGLLLAFVLAAIAYYTPTPYVLEAPGRAIPASSIVRVQDAKARPTNGQFLMATVLIEKATVLLCIYGLLEPGAELTHISELEEGEKAQSPSDDQRQMELSQYLASWVALRSLGYEVRGSYRGLHILRVDEGSPNAGTLVAGDLINELEGYKPPTLEDLHRLCQGKDEKARLSAVIERRPSGPVPLELRLAKIGDRMRLGLVLRPVFERAPLPVRIDFQSTNTSGASAGLCFALEICDQLSSEDLARGRVIAATGTLNSQGQVGGIQGLPFKLVAAERAGAEIFLVPRENWDEVKNSSSAMKIIPVESFQDALDALR